MKKQRNVTGKFQLATVAMKRAKSKSVAITVFLHLMFKHMYTQLNYFFMVCAELMYYLVMLARVLPTTHYIVSVLRIGSI